MATKQELVTQVMQELGVLAAGQNPSDEDYTDVVTRYTQRLELLANDDYADWDEDSIPAAAMPGLVLVVAYDCANLFGAAKNTLTGSGSMTAEDRGLALLRRYMRTRPSYEETRADWF